MPVIGIVMIGVGVIAVVAYAFYLQKQQAEAEAARKKPAARGGARRTGGRAGGGTTGKVATTPAPAAKINWLVGIKGPVAGKNFHVGQRTVTIGRGAQNFIQVDDALCSRKHVQLKPRKGHLLVVDMSSENGTFINDAKVTEAKLMPGNKLTVGPATFEFRLAMKGVQDSTRDRKAAGKETQAETAAAPNLAVVMAALKDANGDVDVAAHKLGMDRNVVQTLAKMQQQ